MSRPRWRPTSTTWIAGALVLGGLLLTGVSWWFLLLTALGTLGPGILREVGWLDDKDELQRHADHRAGYHAFLAALLVAFALVAFFRSGDRAVEYTERMATLFLSLLWFTWFLSSLIAYWGAQRAAIWILRVFGSVVLVFAVLSNLGSEWTGWTALLLHPLLALPFFALAWTAGRWPRLSGVLLLGAFLGMFWLLGGLSALDIEGIVPIFVLGPLLASGLALLFAGTNDHEDDLELLARTIHEGSS